MKTLKKILDNNSSGKKVLILFILTNLVYVLMLLFTIPATMEFANGMKLLDMMPLGYDGTYVEMLFSALGEEGRQFYLYKQLPLDFLYPLLFILSYSLLLAYFLKKLNKFNSWFYLCLLPVIAGIADYAENLGIISLLNAYPNISSSTVNITGAFSVLKSSATTIYFVTLLTVLIILGIKAIAKKPASLKPQQE